MSTEAEKEFQEWQRQLALRCAIEDYEEPTRVHPFVTCPDEESLLDPLERCVDCGGVGYHIGIPNPEWLKIRIISRGEPLRNDCDEV
jgi:hypothetical protein